jgi:hypothetical protein
MSGQRETAIAALMALVTGAYAWTTPPARRLQLWADVPPALRPAVFLFEGGEETYTWQTGAVPKRIMPVRLFIYTDAKDPTVIGSIQQNEIMDALDAAFAISGADLSRGRNTLGGAVYWAKIDGAPFRDPGDLDGDGMLIVPLKLMLP